MRWWLETTCLAQGVRYMVEGRRPPEGWPAPPPWATQGAHVTRGFLANQLAFYEEGRPPRKSVLLSRSGVR